MSIFSFDQPMAFNRFRDHTAGHAKMPGVTCHSFICAKCGKPKLVKGRKPVVKGTSRYGYICATCQ